jgi:hypothetical protein
MENITNIKSAIEYVEEFVSLGDLRVPEVDPAHVDMEGFGFVIRGNEWVYDVDGYKITATYFEPPQGTCILHLYVNGNVKFLTRVYCGEDAYSFVYNSTFDICGTSFTVSQKVTMQQPVVDVINIKNSTTDLRFWPRCGRRIEDFEDLDGCILRAVTDYDNRGVIFAIYKPGWGGLHCRSGPARIHGSEEKYYLNGVRISRKKWLKQRFQEMEVRSEESDSCDD